MKSAPSRTRKSTVEVIRRLGACLALVLVIVGSASHRHELGGGHGRAIDSCSACVLGQAAGVAVVPPAPVAPPTVTTVACALVELTVAPRTIAVLVFAPKTSPPAARA